MLYSIRYKSIITNTNELKKKKKKSKFSETAMPNYKMTFRFTEYKVKMCLFLYISVT